MKETKTREQKLETKETRKPDIAFWFDEDNRYMVMVREGITHIELVQACFDLLARALEANADTINGTFTKEE